MTYVDEFLSKIPEEKRRLAEDVLVARVELPGGHVLRFELRDFLGILNAVPDMADVQHGYTPPSPNFDYQTILERYDDEVGDAAAHIERVLSEELVKLTNELAAKKAA